MVYGCVELCRIETDLNFGVTSIVVRCIFYRDHKKNKNYVPCWGIAQQVPVPGILFSYYMVKGKVFPYSLPSVGPGADPGVQAVSPQVT